MQPLQNVSLVRFYDCLMETATNLDLITPQIESADGEREREREREGEREGEVDRASV